MAYARKEVENLDGLLKNGKKKFVRYEEGAAMFSLGLHSFEQLAKEATTTVSEFTAAMQRMHISEKLIIPLSVMFRFFPTVADEFASINAAMRMRGISFGGSKASKMIEYRFIPLMSCCVKIGEELSAAALTRGLGGDCKRTNVCEIGFHIQDVIALLICIIPFVLFVLEKIGIF